jgi:hypothetical protein
MLQVTVCELVSKRTPIIPDSAAGRSVNGIRGVGRFATPALGGLSASNSQIRRLTAAPTNANGTTMNGTKTITIARSPNWKDDRRTIANLPKT